MSLFNHTRTVDFSNKTVMESIKLIQGEAKARTIHFKLAAGGSAVDLTGCTVRAYILPHGETTPLYEDLTVINAVKGTCDYVVSGNAAATAGDAAMQIEVLVTGSPDPLATGYSKEMTLQVVAKKDFTGAVEGSTVFSALLNALSLAQSLDDNAVHKAGTETITGLKSVPAPIDAAHIANKSYVDQSINSTNTVIGTLANLTTSVKTSIVNAINSLVTRIAALETLLTVTTTTVSYASPATSGSAVLRKSGKTVTCQISITKSGGFLVSEETISTQIPVGWRPSQILVFSGNTTNDSGNGAAYKPIRLAITTDGYIKSIAYATGGILTTGLASWTVD